MSTPIYEIPVQTITGEPTSLAPFRGKVLLVVNVASKCGLTPQYDALEKLFEQFEARDWSCLGSRPTTLAGRSRHQRRDRQPFAGPPSASNFPMFAKIAVTGPAAAPAVPRP